MATISRKTLRPLFDVPTPEEIEAEKRRVAEERAIRAAEKRRVAAERAARAAERASRHTARGVKRVGLSIDEFAFANGFSRAHYYKLKKRNKAPNELRALGKIIITDAAQAAWRKRNTAT